MDFSICILTGGKSSRMGTNKSQLYFEGERLLDKIIEACDHFSDDIFIAGDQENIKLSIPFHPDKQSNKGPLSGIKTALLHSSHDWTLILACDMPLLQNNTLKWLTDEFQQLDQERVAYSATPTRDHYLVGFYHSSLLNQVDELLLSEDLRVRQLLNHNSFKKLLIPDELAPSISNMNSTKDLDTFGWMKIRILTFGQVEEIIGEKELHWITSGNSTADLINELEAKFPALKQISYRLALNETIIENEKLAMNDTIALLPPFAGG